MLLNDREQRTPEWRMRGYILTSPETPIAPVSSQVIGIVTFSGVRMVRFGSQSSVAVSSEGTGPLRLERSGAQHCRRPRFLSRHVKEPRARGIKCPRVTAHGFAQVANRGTPEISFLPR